MINQFTDIKISLHGQYKISIQSDDCIDYDSNWCNNTILSGGLAELYSYSFLEIMSLLDLGSNSTLGGSTGYSLSGVVTPVLPFTNIFNDFGDTFKASDTSRVYHAYYTSIKAPYDIMVREFAVKRNQTSVAFARNVFAQSYEIKKGQHVNFQYRLKVNWNSTVSTKTLSLSAGTGSTFTVPITSTTYNIPHNRAYYNDNKLVLANTANSVIDNSTLPVFGSIHPGSIYSFAINTNKQRSIINPTEISRGHGEGRTYSVSTVYSNITSRTNNTAINFINNAYLVRDGALEVPTNWFHLTRFAFPIIVYNEIGVCLSANVASANGLSLTYKYTWG